MNIKDPMTRILRNRILQAVDNGHTLSRIALLGCYPGPNLSNFMNGKQTTMTLTSADRLFVAVFTLQKLDEKEGKYWEKLDKPDRDADDDNGEHEPPPTEGGNA